MPVILVLCAIGTYGDNSALFDVWVMLGAGVIGYVMRKYGYGPAPLVVGLVLGPVMERSFRQTLIISGGRVESLWEPPICMVMWGVALMSVVGARCDPPGQTENKNPLNDFYDFIELLLKIQRPVQP